MTRWFLTPDLHGNGELARGLLERAGVPLSSQERTWQGIRSVQLGDLANCVLEDAGRDHDLVRDAKEWFDVVLVGNHEHPYWGGTRFSGFCEIPEVKDGLRELERQGRIWPCLLVGDVLVTHAGVAPVWDFTTAEEATRAIEHAWRKEPRAPLFNAIGRARGGRDNCGGVLWSDFTHEPRARFRQIHGHTGMPDGPWLRDRDGRLSIVSGRLEVWDGALNLDVGQRTGRIVGAWLDYDGKVEFVEHEA